MTNKLTQLLNFIQEFKTLDNDEQKAYIDAMIMFRKQTAAETAAIEYLGLDKPLRIPVEIERVERPQGPKFIKMSLAKKPKKFH
jgi:hypothetical protein